MNKEMSAALTQEDLVKESSNDADESSKSESDLGLRGGITENVVPPPPPPRPRTRPRSSPRPRPPPWSPPPPCLYSNNGLNKTKEPEKPKGAEYTPGPRWTPSRTCCIYRVPKSIRRVNEEAYTPQVISIGPFHHGKKDLKDMENLKERLEIKFFDRIPYERRWEVLAFIVAKEQEIRSCYAEHCMPNSHRYRMMIQRDATFIIELLLTNIGEDDRDVESDYNESDFLLRRPAEKIALILDLQLMENQLPYFLLKGLYEKVGSSRRFVDLCSNFFKDQMLESVPNNTVFKHFIDLRRAALVNGFPRQEFRHEYREIYIPCATKLHESGVKFTRAPEMGCLLEIRFEEGEIRIPQLNVYDETEAKLRNIMALEQCCYPDDTLVCDYVALLDSLIDGESDVDLLVEGGIISNCMGEKKALVSMFKKLCSHIPSRRFYYYKIYQALNAHYDEPWNRAMATLKSVYFKDRWRGTATVAATVGLLLTFISALKSFLDLVT